MRLYWYKLLEPRENTGDSGKGITSLGRCEWMILLLIFIVAGVSLVESWVIAFIAGLLGIELSFKVIFFVVFIFNLFFKSSRD